ncbi:MAG: T9SS type A sorting domain-containing protein [Bacteroidetes bacterium]|nr:T9SS type A sorting domain-containing protein [Bacteroidota bacterium]
MTRRAPHLPYLVLMFSFHRSILVLLILFVAATRPVQAQDTLKVMYYNLLNFPDGGAVNRQDTMERIFDYVRPDVLFVCELNSVSGANELLATLNGLGAGPYQRANYVANQSSENNLQNMCFYRSDKLSLLGQDEILTGLRDINEYELFQVDGLTGDTVFIDFYVAHLKAAAGGTNEAEREAAILNLKAHLNTRPPGRNVVFGGDLNFYDSFENGYQALLNNPPVLFEDPINRPGSWSNNIAFDDIHTQSTRSTSFGGGASGGLDDRFDIILLSENILDATGNVRYNSGSYKAIGNDGAHFNQSVNNGVNNSAPPAVISALYQSSDHLPVVLELILNSEPTVPVDTGGGCGELFFSEYIEGSSNNKALELYNAGSETLDLSAYSIALYNNGSTTANSTLALVGLLAAGQTYQVVNSSANAALLALADATSGVTFYNGDDALALFRGSEVIDQIGIIGVDPGTNWVVGTGATSEYTLVRKPEVTAGQTDWALGAGEWLVFPQDDFSKFGSHSADPCEEPPVLCSPTSAPTGLASSVAPGGVSLSWDDLDGTVKCEVNGRPAGAPSFAKIRVNVPPYAAFVPAAQLNPGTTYEWKVRCACTLSPLVATPFSTLENFVWPTARIAEDAALTPNAPIGIPVAEMFPNPAADVVHLRWSGVEPSLAWTLVDVQGKTVASGLADQALQQVSIAHLPAGIYKLRSTGNFIKTLGTLVVLR